MTIRSASEGILSDDNAAKREELTELLKQAYWMEIETVMSYIANSINPDGVRAQEIIESLQQDITEELGHAQQFANRIKELYGVVPGSLDFKAEQSYLQPPEHQTDIVHVIRGVIEAETGRSSTTTASSSSPTAWTSSRRTWSSRSFATRRATAACSRVTCGSTRRRAWPKLPPSPQEGIPRGLKVAGTSPCSTCCLPRCC